MFRRDFLKFAAGTATMVATDGAQALVQSNAPLLPSDASLVERAIFLKDHGQIGFEGVKTLVPGMIRDELPQQAARLGSTPEVLEHVQIIINGAKRALGSVQEIGTYEHQEVYTYHDVNNLLRLIQSEAVLSSIFNDQPGLIEAAAQYSYFVTDSMRELRQYVESNAKGQEDTVGTTREERLAEILVKDDFDLRALLEEMRQKIDTACQGYATTFQKRADARMPLLAKMHKLGQMIPHHGVYFMPGKSYYQQMAVLDSWDDVTGSGPLGITGYDFSQTGLAGLRFGVVQGENKALAITEKRYKGREESKLKARSAQNFLKNPIPADECFYAGRGYSYDDAQSARQASPWAFQKTQTPQNTARMKNIAEGALEILDIASYNDAQDAQQASPRAFQEKQTSQNAMRTKHIEEGTLEVLDIANRIQTGMRIIDALERAGLTTLQQADTIMLSQIQAGKSLALPPPETVEGQILRGICPSIEGLEVHGDVLLVCDDRGESNEVRCNPVAKVESAPTPA